MSHGDDENLIAINEVDEGVGKAIELIAPGLEIGQRLTERGVLYRTNGDIHFSEEPQGSLFTSDPIPFKRGIDLSRSLGMKSRRPHSATFTSGAGSLACCAMWTTGWFPLFRNGSLRFF